MGRIRIVNFVSIDGVIQSPLSVEEDQDGGFQHGGWVPPYSDATVDTTMSEATIDAAGFLLGRRTFEHMQSAWEGADQSDPSIAAMNQKPKHVVTSGTRDLGWINAHKVAGEDLAEQVSHLKQTTEGNLVVFGSGSLVEALTQHGLVDEYLLLQFPILLGVGKRMFGDLSAPTHVSLVETSISTKGVLILTYALSR